ncbi:MAG: hypothetical protein RI973_1510 [Bacteroidota bacterium]|jgi:RNA polymerase sigma-70 factor (ECF subfamily)
MPEFQPDILDACRSGDRFAQRRLYEHFKGKMFVVCLRYAYNRHDAEDILQEGFVKVFRDLHQYKGVGSLEGWIRKVILNTALQYIRQQKSLLNTVDFDQQAFQIREDDSPEDDNQEMARLLLRLMHEMPPGFRTVLNLYILEGFSHQEIADELQISVGTSKSQLNRAKAFLKGLLEKSLAK